MLEKDNIPTVTVYNPKGEILYTNVDEYDILLFRCEAKKKHLKGYYFIFKEQKVLFMKDGSLDSYPDDLFSRPISILDHILNF